MLDGREQDELSFLKEQGSIKEDSPVNSQEQPKDEPRAQEPASEQPEAPVTPEPPKAASDDFYRSVLGEWADPDKIVSLPERLRMAEQLAQENEELKKKSSPSFANESVAKFNSFVSKTGISDFGVFQKLESFDPQTADAKDKLAMQMILENPSIAGKYSFDKVVKLVEKKFGIDSDLDPEDEEAQFGQMTLDLESAKADKYLNQIKESLGNYNYQEQPKIDYSAIQNNWTPVVRSISDKFDKIEVKFDEKSEGVDFEYHVNPADKSVIVDEVLNYLVQNGSEFSETNVKMAKDIIVNRFKVENFSKILSAFKAKLESDFVKTSTEKYNNASDLTNADANKRDLPMDEESPAEKAFRLEMQGML
jgi:hypothetical protein